MKEFEHYVRLWIPLVEKFGGKHHGYFLPSEGSAWEVYALGWSLVFQDEMAAGSEKLSLAKSIFESARRNDLADACQSHIEQLRQV